MNGCESKLNYPVSSATAAGWRSRRRAFWNIGRERKLRRADVVSALGEDSIRRIYRYADTFHCEQIAKVTDGADPVPKLMEMHASLMSNALSRFNSDLFYQSRGYIAECYRAGKILAA